MRLYWLTQTDNSKATPIKMEVDKEVSKSQTLPIEKPSQSTTEAVPKARNRKSRNVRKQSAEKYRFHANDAWQRNFDLMQAQKYGYTLPFMDVTPQKLDPPTLNVPINVNLVNEIVHETHEYAVSVLKVVPKADDELVLKTVSNLQIAAKVHYANKNNEQETSVTIDNDMKFIATHFDKAIEPMAYFIDNIGSTQIEEQVVTPTLAECSTAGYPLPYSEHVFNMGLVAVPPNDSDIVIPTGVIDDFGMETQIIVSSSVVGELVRQGVYNPVENVIAEEYMQLRTPHRLLKYQRVGMRLDVLAQQYQDILNRYSRRVRGKIRDLGIKVAAGKLTQLVGSDSVADRLGVVDAWCMRKIDDGTLTTGAMLRLGTTHFHRSVECYALKRGMVSRSQAVGKIVALIG